MKKSLAGVGNPPSCKLGSTARPRPLRISGLALLFAAIASLSLGSAHAQPTPSQIYQGLVSYWPMDTITSGATPDVVSGINLTAAGSPSTTSGKFGNGIVLNGTSQYFGPYRHAMAGRGHQQPGLGPSLLRRNAIHSGVLGQGSGADHCQPLPLYDGQHDQYTAALLPPKREFRQLVCKLDAIVRPIQNNPPINHAYTANNTFLDGTWHHVAWVDSYG